MIFGDIFRDLLIKSALNLTLEGNNSTCSKLCGHLSNSWALAPYNYGCNCETLTALYSSTCYKPRIHAIKLSTIPF